jgi:hypothetical protein
LPSAAISPSSGGVAGEAGDADAILADLGGQGLAGDAAAAAAFLEAVALVDAVMRARS